MDKLSRWSLRHQLLIVVAALVVSVAGVVATVLGFGRLTEHYAFPGLPAYDANQRILATYGNGGDQQPYVPVIRLPAGTTVDSDTTRDALGRAFERVAAQENARVLSYANTGDRAFVGTDGRTVVGLVFPGPRSDGSPPGGGLGETADRAPTIAGALRPALPPGTSVQVTGIDALAPGEDAGGLNAPVKIAVGLAAAVLVLLFVFRSALALVPVLVALVAIPAACLALMLLTLVTDVHEGALTTVPLIGLGIGVDYSLLLVARWREELARGWRGADAVHRAMRTAGHAVVFSGAAVGLGLITMVVLPVPFLRSLGVGGMLVAATSTVVALTLLPVVLLRSDDREVRRLERAGRRSASAQIVSRHGPGVEAEPSARWLAWARAVVRFRGAVAVVTGGLLLALSVVATDIDLGVPETKDLTRSGPAAKALSTMGAAGLPAGMLTSFDVLVPTGIGPDGVASNISEVPGVRTVASPSGEAWESAGGKLLVVVPDIETGSDDGAQLLNNVRQSVRQGVLVGGNAAQTSDFVEATYTWFPALLGLVAVVTFVMLARAFRSLLLPLKAIMLNLLSLGAVLGALVLLWQYGFGTQQLLGLEPSGVVGTFVPVTVFAFLFGLSMDYEVFILARMREEYDRTGSTQEAVVQGLARTGRLVTYAALILFLSFASLASGGEVDVAVFASGLALGILLDATLVRGLLLPATVALLGRWNWWFPWWAACALRVPTSCVAATACAPAGVPDGAPHVNGAAKA